MLGPGSGCVPARVRSGSVPAPVRHRPRLMLHSDSMLVPNCFHSISFCSPRSNIARTVYGPVLSVFCSAPVLVVFPVLIPTRPASVSSPVRFRSGPGCTTARFWFRSLFSPESAQCFVPGPGRAPLGTAPRWFRFGPSASPMQNKPRFDSGTVIVRLRPGLV